MGGVGFGVFFWGGGDEKGEGEAGKKGGARGKRGGNGGLGLVLAGAIPAALLALCADGVLGTFEKRMVVRR